MAAPSASLGSNSCNARSCSSSRSTPCASLSCTSYQALTSFLFCESVVSICHCCARHTCKAHKHSTKGLPCKAGTSNLSTPLLKSDGSFATTPITRCHVTCLCSHVACAGHVVKANRQEDVVSRPHHYNLRLVPQCFQHGSSGAALAVILTEQRAGGCRLCRHHPWELLGWHCLHLIHS